MGAQQPHIVHLVCSSIWLAESNMDGATAETNEAVAKLVVTEKNDVRKAKVNTHCIQPIALKGHTRSITFLQYNRDSDLLFTCAKDTTPTVFYTANGERIGTFNGHTGANTKLNVSADSSLLITGAADMYAKLWNVKNGHCIKSWRHRTPVRAVGINLGMDQVLTANDPVMRQEPTIFIWDIEDENDGANEEDRRTRAEDQCDGVCQGFHSLYHCVF